MITLTGTTMAPSVERLTSAGQSIWLDFIRRAFIDSGDLKDYVDRGWITGLTSNPSIFAKAIAGSTDYDATIWAFCAASTVIASGTMSSTIAAQEKTGV